MINIQTLATGSKGNCYLISDGISSLLLEAGIPFKDIQSGLQFDTSHIVGCLITHEHQDHCKGVRDVLKRGINCYMSEGTKGMLGIEHHNIHGVGSKVKFEIGTWTILPFDVEHDVSNPLGFLIVNQEGEKLLFATDTYFIRYKFAGLNYIMVECNYSLDILNENIKSGRVHKGMKKRLLRSHFSLDNVKEFLSVNDLSKVQEIHLLHLSDSNSCEKRFKKEVQETTGKMVIVP